MIKLTRKQTEILQCARSLNGAFLLEKKSVSVLALCNAGYLEERANVPQAGRLTQGAWVLTALGKEALAKAEQAQIDKIEDARRNREYRELKRRERDANAMWGFNR